MSITVPEYFLHALTQLGTLEVPGAESNPRILAYWQEAGISLAKGEGDEVPWCAAFVGAMLARGGIQNSGKGLAKSYQLWGSPGSGTGLIGAVVVLNRPDPAPKWQGHVGFCCGLTADKVHVLGGNQHDRVSIAAFPRTRVAAIRWPGGILMPASTLLLPVSEVDPADR